MHETIDRTGFDPVEERIPGPRLMALGLQHVLVMYAGAIAVPLIVGRALQLSPQDVAFLISADLFVCGIVTIIQSFGATQWFGIKLPVMMGVTFAAVGPMVAIASASPGQDGARMMFGAIMAAGLISIFFAPLVGRLLRFFPSVVTGTVILVIGVSLMPVGINWLFGLPVGPTAPKLVDPEQAAWLQQAIAAGGVPEGVKLLPTMPNPEYASVPRIVIGLVVLASILLISRYARGFLANVAVLMGIVIGGLLEDSYSQGQDKVPVMGDIPVLGNLFRSENRTRNKTNLMVFLRPIVVRDTQVSDALMLDRYEAIRALQQNTQPEDRVMLRGVSEAPVLPAMRGDAGAPPRMLTSQPQAGTAPAPAPAPAAPFDTAPQAPLPPN